MPKNYRDLGTLVISSEKSWILKDISIFVNTTVSGPLAGYAYRLTFLASGEEAYSVPERIPDYNNYLQADVNNYIRAKRCQVDPNNDAHPMLLLRGVPLGHWNRPIVIAQTEYSTRVHGSSLMFRLDVGRYMKISDKDVHADQSAVHKHSVHQDDEGRNYDIGVFSTTFGKGGSADETTDPTSSDGRERGAEYVRPDLRTLQLTQIGVP